MNFVQSFKLAINSLRTSKMRSFLTMLGIIIGVAAVIVIISLGNGMQNLMNQQFDDMGANLVQVQVMSRGDESTRTIEPEDMYALVNKYPQYLSGVSPYVQASGIKVRRGSTDFKHTKLYGVSEVLFNKDSQKTIDGKTLSEGRFLQYIDVERKQNVCVIGSFLAQNAFSGDALGETLATRSAGRPPSSPRSGCPRDARARWRGCRVRAAATPGRACTSARPPRWGRRTRSGPAAGCARPGRVGRRACRAARRARRCRC